MCKIIIPNTDRFALEDSDVLGVFVKLLLFSTKMTVNGVFVNGKVFAPIDIADGAGIDIDDIKRLEARKLIDNVYGVYFIDHAREFFNCSKRYSQHTFSALMSRIRETVLPAKDVVEIADRLTECGDFEMENDYKLKDKILELYNSLDAGRGKIQSYVGMFRTKNQVTTGSRMKLSRHFRLLSEIKEIYELGSFDYDGQRYSTSKEKVLIAIDIMLQKQMLGLSNHNYLKVILKNDNNRTTGNAKGKTDEGY